MSVVVSPAIRFPFYIWLASF